MTNIIKKTTEDVSRFDPFRALREWMRWDPFREMAPVLQFEEQPWLPSFEVKENKDGYVFRADLPGVKPEDLEIRLTGNRLQFHGKREAEKEEKGETYYTCERSFGAFTRTFTLPDGCDVDHVRSELKDGVLTAVVPKKAEAQSKKIPISTATPKS
jgi:HSP20 family protein